MPKKDLTEFIEQVTGDRHLRVEDDLGDGFVVLRVSEAERRQARHDVRSTEDIVIEMLRNARDAHAKHIFVATSREGTTRHLTMIDDGDGIPSHMFNRIFEARVTSKLDTVHIDTWGVHGRGMALYAVRMNTKKAFVASSLVGGGSAFVIESDTTLLPEKVDQSSFPTFTVTGSGTIAVRGTRNINRTVTEFAYVDRETCSVYLGSPVEIAATLWEFGTLLLPAVTRAFCTNPNEVDVCKRIALASSPEEFSQIASGIGLNLSPRSARRIMDGEVEALLPVSDSVVLENAAGNASKNNKKGSKRALKDARGLKISAADKAEFAAQVRQAFQPLAESYFLEGNVDVSVGIRANAIHISIPVEKLR